jgi:maleamate amidohydrolase
VHIEGFGGRGGFGQHPALILMDMPLGFADPEPPLGSGPDGPMKGIQKLLGAGLDGERE